MKNFKTPTTLISLIACYFAVKYLINNHALGNDIFMFMLAMFTCLLYAWTIYFGVREKTFLVLFKVIVLLIAFPLLAIFSLVNALLRYLTGKEMMWLFVPVHWILKQINKSIQK
jgi:hypothetical protein